MAEETRIDQLNDAVEAILAGPRAPRPAVTPEIAALVRLAEDLRNLPDERFRARLKSELMSAAKENRTMPEAATAVSPIRAGFHTVTPYLVVQGAAKLIDFMKQAFGAEEHGRVAPTPGGPLMHAEVKIGDSMLELADANQQFPTMRSALHLYVPDADEVYRQAIAAGAISTHAPMDQPYGDREGSITDPVGNHWYIATHKAGAPGAFVPEGLRTITPYLHLKGASEFIDFLKSAFQAEELARYANPDGAIMHARVRFGDSIIEMGEAHGQWGPMPTTLHLYVPDADAVYRSAVDAGATSLMEPRDQPYGDRSGGVTDAWGNRWFIATHFKDVSF
jgi:PhnB protein